MTVAAQRLGELRGSLMAGVDEDATSFEAVRAARRRMKEAPDDRRRSEGLGTRASLLGRSSTRHRPAGAGGLRAAREDPFESEGDDRERPHDSHGSVGGRGGRSARQRGDQPRRTGHPERAARRPRRRRGGARVVLAPMIAVPSRPRVLLNCAISIDGRLAYAHGRRALLSGPQDLARVMRIRASVDAILVGVGTVLADDPSLRVHWERIGGPAGRNPTRVVLDSRGRTPAASKVLDGSAPTIIATATGCEQRFPPTVTALAVGHPRVDLPGLLEALCGRGITTLLVEGGAEVLASFLRGALFDELTVYVAPVVIGGPTAPRMVAGPETAGAGPARPARTGGRGAARRRGPDDVPPGGPRTVIGPGPSDPTGRSREARPLPPRRTVPLRDGHRLGRVRRSRHGVPGLLRRQPGQGRGPEPVPRYAGVLQRRDRLGGPDPADHRSTSIAGGRPGGPPGPPREPGSCSSPKRGSDCWRP